MGTDRVEFDRGELRVVGGDYGTLTIEGLTHEARGALDAIVAGNRRCSERTSVLGLVVEHDDTPDLFEDRHAGREGAPYERSDATDNEGGSAATSVGAVRPATAPAEGVSPDTKQLHFEE